MSTTKAVPTMEDIAQLQGRFDSMQGRAGTLAERLAEVNAELARLLADDKGDSDKAQELRQERRVLQDELEELEAAIPLLRTRIAEGTESAGKAAAEKEIARLAKRSAGFRQVQESRVNDFLSATKALEEAAEKLRDNYVSSERDLGEALHLNERFGLDLLEFNGPVIPGRIPAVTEAVIDLANLGVPEHPGQARKYPPRENSTAEEILAFVGPLPEPEPKPSVVARRKREQESRERFRRETEQLLGQVSG